MHVHSTLHLDIMIYSNIIVIGACIAYMLNQSGRNVTFTETNEPLFT